jgi:glycosyltransferase involved in cell wall biosynthesis
MNKEDVSLIIPAFNEGKTIGRLIERIRELHPAFELIVVDDGSSDGTAEEARRAGATVFSHPYNIGNGAAVKSGIRIASGDILVFMDADGQHNPEDISSLLQCFPDYDMAVGARPFKGHSSWFRAMGNTLYNRLASYVARFPVKDLTSGFRAVRAEIAREFLYLLPNTYSYPTTLTLAVLRSGRSVKYLPIHPEKRQAGKSNIGMARDGIRFFLIIAKICTIFSPFRIFLPISVVLFLLGIVYYAYTFVAHHRFTNMSALLLSTSILVFMMGLISEQICQMRYDRSA